MSERLYGRWSNVLMLVAIGSALLFDSATSWHVLAGLTGIAAGLAAVTLYFVNQHCSPAKQDAPKQKSIVVDGMSIPTYKLDTKTRDMYAIMVGAYAGQYAARAYRHDTKHPYLSHYVARRARHLNAHALYWYGGEADRALLRPEVQLSPNEVAECAIEIIRNLSTGDELNEWEFNFGPDGLRVIAKKGQEQRPAMPQEDLDFGHMSTAVH